MSQNHRYDNSHNKTGTAIIICNVKFEEFAGQKCRDRPVAVKDVERLKPILHKRGFQVFCYWNKGTIQMQTILEEVARDEDNKYQHDSSDCLLVVLSSHGYWMGTDQTDQTLEVINGSDGRIVQIEQLVESTRSPKLAGKPIIFLLQCCRGSDYQTNVEVIKGKENEVLQARVKEFKGSDIKQLNDAAEISPQNISIPYRVPIRRDVLLHYATTPGHVSFKKANEPGAGTPFLQAWCKCLEADTSSVDLLSMTTLVCAHVATTYESNAPSNANRGAHKRKQMPQAVSMLTKEFYFGKKSSYVPEPVDVDETENA